MNNFVKDKLVEKISKDLSIRRPQNEAENAFLERLIYSVSANTAYTSLWDIKEDTDISVSHFKDRVEEEYRMLYEIYPNIHNFSDLDLGEFSDHIYELYRKTGCFYHSSDRISPCIRTEEAFNDITLLRGQSPDEKVSMSGAGYYIPKGSNHLETDNMWNIPETTLSETYDILLKRAEWKKFDLSYDNFEFLNLSIKPGTKYFVNRPKKYDTINLMRTTVKSERQYFLFRNDIEPLYAPLPKTMTVDKEWLTIANAIWEKNELKPGITYKVENDITTIKLRFLLPPALSDFYLLYTWPSELGDFSSMFERIMSNEVFAYFEDKLRKAGYTIIRRGK